jgi:hypothetical protein
MDSRIQNKFERKTMIPFAALLSIGEKVLDKVIPDPRGQSKGSSHPYGDGPAWQAG